MKTVFLLLAIALIINLQIAKAEAKNSLFEQSILNRTSLDKEIKDISPPLFSKVRIISILANPKEVDTGFTKITLENNHNTTVLLKGWYLQTKKNIYYFTDEFIENNSYINLTKIGKQNIFLKNTNERLKLYDQNSRLIQEFHYTSAPEDIHLTLDKTTGLFNFPQKIFQTETTSNLLPEVKESISNPSPLNTVSNEIKSLASDNFAIKKKSELDSEMATQFNIDPLPTPISNYIILFLLLSSAVILIVKKQEIIRS